MAERHLILYHGGCPDGFCAAFVADLLLGGGHELTPCLHGQPPPDVTGRQVLVVDFAWARELMDGMARASASFRVFDHHVTAQEALWDCPYAVFDLTRSGAGLTWDLLAEGQPRPWYVEYVEDRDLWRFALPQSREVNAYLMALPYTVEAWAVLAHLQVAQAEQLGSAIRLHIEHYIERVAADGRPAVLSALRATIVNAAYPNISDVLERVLAADSAVDVAIGYFARGDGLVQFSVRGRPEVDCAALAQAFGGGGHRGAAGWQMSPVWAAALLDDAYRAEEFRSAALGA